MQSHSHEETTAAGEHGANRETGYMHSSFLNPKLQEAEMRKCADALWIIPNYHIYTASFHEPNNVPTLSSQSSTHITC